MTEFEHSLRRLQTDYIDLYQYHRPDTETGIEETLSVLSDLVRSGKVRTIGTSKLPAADIVEAQWVAERRGFERFRTEQPPYSILNRGIEHDVLPVAERYGMGTIVWSPLAQGLLTGRVRKGQQSDLRRSGQYFTHLLDERRIDVVEQLIPLADEAGLSLTHLAMAFAIAHPGVTAALLGPRTMEQLDDLLAGTQVMLSDDILDRIDAIVPPGTDVGQLDMAYNPPAVMKPGLRRRPIGETDRCVRFRLPAMTRFVAGTGPATCSSRSPVSRQRNAANGPAAPAGRCRPRGQSSRVPAARRRSPAQDLCCRGPI
jgi:diketogulonate reductase-like aldo/keto reductase